MQIGDWGLVGKILGIKSHNAYMSFLRPTSKRFQDVVAAIEKVVENREKLLTDKKNNARVIKRVIEKPDS
jgi:translation initiation factor 2 alpha subunit (eIF-2alpha)